MTRFSASIAAVLTIGVLAVSPGSSSAALEGVRDCGDVTSKPWTNYEETATDILEYRGDQWFVFGYPGLQPSCAFARRWAKLGVREAVHAPKHVYKHAVKKSHRPAGWKCTVTNAPTVLYTNGGILQCRRYKGGKLVGSFSAGPDFNEQEGPY